MSIDYESARFAFGVAVANRIHEGFMTVSDALDGFQDDDESFEERSYRSGFDTADYDVEEDYDLGSIANVDDFSDDAQDEIVGDDESEYEEDDGRGAQYGPKGRSGITKAEFLERRRIWDQERSARRLKAYQDDKEDTEKTLRAYQTALSDLDLLKWVDYVAKNEFVRKHLLGFMCWMAFTPTLAQIFLNRKGNLGANREKFMRAVQSPSTAQMGKAMLALASLYLNRPGVKSVKTPFIQGASMVVAPFAPVQRQLISGTGGSPREAAGPCKHFATNSCKFGDKCRFSHGPLPRSDRPCFDFIKGNCTRGDSCKFLHEAPTPDQPGPEAAEKETKVVVYSPFRYNKPPPRAMLHSPAGCTDVDSFDQGGAPFCGFTAIDLATGTTPDVEQYRLRVPDGMQPLDIGTPEFLSDYAKERGVNVLFKIPAIGDGEAYIIYNPVSSAWDSVTLLFQSHHVVIGVISSGHWTIGMGREAPAINLKMPAFPEPTNSITNCRSTIIVAGLALGAVGAGATYASTLMPTGSTKSGVRNFGVLSSALGAMLVGGETVSTMQYEHHTVTGYTANSDSRDVRPIMDRRDGLDHQDRYAHVETTTRLGYSRRASLKLPDVLFPSKKRTISVSRYTQAMLEMQALAAAGMCPSNAIGSVFRHRNVNTSNENNISAQTADLLEDLVRDIKVGNYVEKPPTIAYNCPSNGTVISDSDLSQISANQVAGTGRKMGDPLFNHFEEPKRKNRRKKLEACKTGVPVAVTVGLIVKTDKGYVGPGNIQVTDQLGGLVAASLRAMSKPMVDGPRVEEFVSFSKEFLKPYIDSCPPPARVELPFVDEYRIAFKGKKAAKVIEANIKEYQQYLMDGFCEKKYKRAALFNKFEDNSKVVDGIMTGRPRNIIVMPAVMAMETVAGGVLAESWYAGDIKKHQIKHYSSSEVAEIVCKHMDKKFSVTDFSAFESSITASVRELEGHVLLSLAEKWNFPLFKDAYIKYTDGYRRIYSKSGVLLMSTRCSGDPWTSMGNGIVNVSLGAWCSHLDGKDPTKLEMIAEGDDGLIAQGTLNPVELQDLGFKFSSEVEGSRPGDADLLRSLWEDDKRYLDIGRAINCLWVKRAANLRPAKQKYLLRCAGLSMHYLAPGHPILFELVNKIGFLTKDSSDFKGSAKYLDTWGKEEVDFKGSYPRGVKVDESMRARVEQGAVGFPPITRADQLTFERRIREADGVVYIGNILEGFKDLDARVEAKAWLNPHEVATTESIKKLLGIFSNVIRAGVAESLG